MLSDMHSSIAVYYFPCTNLGKKGMVWRIKLGQGIYRICFKKFPKDQFSPSKCYEKFLQATFFFIYLFLIIYSFIHSFIHSSIRSIIYSSFHNISNYVFFYWFVTCFILTFSLSLFNGKDIDKCLIFIKNWILYA